MNDTHPQGVSELASRARDTGSSNAWPTVAVYGAGAVGSYFGAKFALAGAPVTLIARPIHVEAIRERGLLFESGGDSRHLPIHASDQADAVANADLVLICVKSRDTVSAAREVVSRLRPGAIALSLQNGVDNAGLMREQASLDAMAAVVYVGASMPGPGHLRHAGRGELVIGEYGPPLPGVARDPGRGPRVVSWCERAGFGCKRVDDIHAALWTKLVMNAVYNAISALTHATYAKVVTDEAVVATMREAIRECVAVARAEGVAIRDADALADSAIAWGAALHDVTSSTQQDLSAGRPTEIDALNGYVVRRGDALGVPTPVNRALTGLVRLADRVRRNA